MGTRHGHRPMAPPGGRGRPARRGALQNWGAGIRRGPVPAGRHPGALAPHAPHRPMQPRCDGLRVGWEAVADGTLLALLHRDAADGYQWDTLAPHLTGRHVYMAPPPQGHPRPAWDDLIAAFHDHGILPDDTWREVQRKTLGRDYWRRVRARLLEIRDPFQQRRNDLWFRHLDPWSPPSHLPHTCRLCGECDTVSSAASTGANRCAPCAQVAACPTPEPPAGPRRRTEEEALH